MADDVSERLARLEMGQSNLGKRVEDVVALLERMVRVEERQQAQSGSISDCGRRMTTIEGRVTTLETANASDRNSIDWMGRLIWMGVGGGGALLGWLVKAKVGA